MVFYFRFPHSFKRDQDSFKRLIFYDKALNVFYYNRWFLNFFYSSFGDLHLLFEMVIALMRWPQIFKAVLIRGQTIVKLLDGIIFSINYRFFKF